MTNLYCSMIHGGLNLVFDRRNAMDIGYCCLLPTNAKSDIDSDFWNHPAFVPVRNKNLTNEWHPACANCKSLEKNNLISFRQGMNQGLLINGKTNLSGPARIDLKFDISCNLACRTCGSHSSTFWQKHLADKGQWHGSITVGTSKDQVIRALSKLDLTNLRQLVFCGGETLLGQAYWQVAQWLADHVPNAKNQLTLCFQTNGTQSIAQRNFEIIDKFFLVKLHVSLDGVNEQFEYLRWPASWSQVTDNILSLREHAPGNVMFVVEETVSIFNLAYLDRLEKFIQKNFSTNRFGDEINHTRHLAHGTYEISRCSQEYVEAVKHTAFANLISSTWQESPEDIQRMITDIRHNDSLRGQQFQQVFPEVAGYYSRFL